VADLDAIPRRLAALMPAAVINGSGFTDVAAAELASNASAVARLNAEAPAALASACARGAIPFVHVSTDYVFDGTKTTPYGEDDPVHPLQAYGRSKLEGERAVLAAFPGALVVRVSTLYGPSAHRRPAYVDAIAAQARARAAEGGGVIEVVERPVSSPTHVADVAPALLDLLDRSSAGIVHVVNDGAASRLDLARATVALAGLADRVVVRTRPEPEGALARPAYSVLDTAKLQRLIGRRLPRWEDALARYISASSQSTLGGS
jgi:dTDP-4-dehydrorhamnose reductase